MSGDEVTSTDHHFGPAQRSLPSAKRIVCRLILALALLTVALAPAPPAAAQTGGPRCFPETGHCIAGQIATFWEANGGLPVFGLPISPLVEVTADGRTVRAQWFERARLEQHPDQPPAYQVQLGRVGVEALQSTGRDWRSFAPAPAGPGCRRFAETGHAVCGPILAAWLSQGLELDGRPGLSDAERLALFGLPLSSLQEERLADGRVYQVQWFERARFELHPELGEAQVLLGLLGREARPAEIGRPLPLFARGACSFRAPAGARVECGSLIVPLERDRPDSRSAAIAVAIFRDPRPAADPILYLAGGPGSPALESASTLWQAWRPFVAGRDLIVVDQRGVGASWPDLRCPEVSAFVAQARREGLSGRAFAKGEAAALLSCRDRIEAAGTPMRAFTSAASAADLEDLRVALGYERWNVLGISYGTRLALALLRDHPAGLRSLVLDSPYPLQESLFATMPANLDRSLATLFRGCAAHPSCAAAYPGLEARFWRLVAALNASPAAVDLGAGPTSLSGDRLIEIMFRQLYASSSLPRLPAAIVAAEGGDFGPLRALVASRASAGVGQSQALYYAIQCAEDLGTLGPGWREAALAGRERLAGFYSGLLELSGEAEALCAGFGAAAPDPRWRVPARSDLPVLLLSGEYDPITPPAWRERAAEGLSRAYGFTLPGTGHAAIGRGACPAALIRAFLDAPTRAPDGTCVERLGPPNFQ